MSRLVIEGIEFYALHGCFTEEQIIGTKFVVDIEFEVNTSEAEQTDDITKAIDYVKVYELIRFEMQITSKLLEHVARRILASLHKTYPSITDATVTVSKLNPPVHSKTTRVSVTLNTSDIVQK